MSTRLDQLMRRRIHPWPCIVLVIGMISKKGQWICISEIKIFKILKKLQFFANVQFLMIFNNSIFANFSAILTVKKLQTISLIRRIDWLTPRGAQAVARAPSISKDDKQKCDFLSLIPQQWSGARILRTQSHAYFPSFDVLLHTQVEPAVISYFKAKNSPSQFKIETFPSRSWTN